MYVSMYVCMYVYPRSVGSIFAWTSNIRKMMVFILNALMAVILGTLESWLGVFEISVLFSGMYYFWISGAPDL